MKKYICKLIWDFYEFTTIPLGRFTPYIFAGMLGCKYKKIKKEIQLDS